MSQINYAVSIHSRETATLKDVSRCCCPGDCLLESGLHPACIPHFSLGLCISVDSLHGQRPQIKCKEMKQQAWSMNVMCWKWHVVYKEYHSVDHLNIELNTDAWNVEFLCPIWDRRDSKWHFLMVELLRWLRANFLPFYFFLSLLL